jgi:hypothetical protein
MTTTPQTGCGERSLETIRANAPAPIDETWKDEFVESLLRELRRQLQQLQNSPPAPHAEDAGVRAANVQALARIQRSLDRLLKMQEQRALARDKKGAIADADQRAALERDIDSIVAAAIARGNPDKAQQ